MGDAVQWGTKVRGTEPVATSTAKRLWVKKCTKCA